MPALRRVDILAHEHSHDRISEAALKTGRWLQAVYAQPERSRVITWVREGRGGIGEIGERLLAHVLGGKSYRECAMLKDRLASEADVTFIAKSFRHWLQAVADMRQNPRALPRRI